MKINPMRTILIALLMSFATQAGAQEKEPCQTVVQCALEEVLESVLEEALEQKFSIDPLLSNENLTSFRRQIISCWATNNITFKGEITVGLQMNKDGTVKRDTIEIINYDTANNKAVVDKAFSLVKQALIACEKNGYDLPSDKYNQWNEIEIVFVWPK
jgi:hypothetical protein